MPTFSELLDGALRSTELRWSHVACGGSFYVVGQGAGWIIRVMIRAPLHAQGAATPTGDAVWVAGSHHVILREEQAVRALALATAAASERETKRKERRRMIGIGLWGRIPDEAAKEITRLLDHSYPTGVGGEPIDEAVMIGLLADVISKLGYVEYAARLRAAREDPQRADAVLDELTAALEAEPQAPQED
jgi:hypothetical protein